VDNYSELFTEQGRDKAKINTIAAQHGRTAYPCEVVGVHKNTKDGRVFYYVDIEPQNYQLSSDKKPIEQSIIYNVPTQQWQGGKCAIIIAPQIGDRGFALICHMDISGIKNSIGRKSPPVSNRHNSYSDSIYLGMMFGEEPVDFVLIEPQKITIKTTEVQINADTVKISKDLEVGGNVKVSKNLDVMGYMHNAGVQVDRFHLHGGVMVGIATTTPPVS